MTITRRATRVRPHLLTLEPRVTPAVFALATDYPGLTTPAPGQDGRTESVAAADFNGDGWPDAAAVRLTGDVTVFLNDGTGKLVPTTALAGGGDETFGSTLAAGDFDGDGNQDLAVFANGPGAPGQRLRLFRGNGAGGFDAGTLVPDVADAFVLKTGDLNGDGVTDLVVTSDKGISVLLGQKSGTFAPAVGYDLPPEQSVDPATHYTLLAQQTPHGVAVADFNKDGRPDVAVTSYPNGNVVMFLGTGRGDLVQSAASSVLPADGGSYRDYTGFGTLAAADFDGDGNLDLAAHGYTTSEGDLVVARGRGDGTFAPPTTVESGFPTNFGPAVGDFNADGKPDIAFDNYTIGLPGGAYYDARARGVATFLGDGTGRFTYVIDSTNPSGGQGAGIVDGLAVADFNKDGRSDLVIAAGGGSVLVVPAAALPTGPLLLAGAAGGLVQIDAATGAVRMRIDADPNGSARTASGDVNGDGVPDIVVGNGAGAASRVRVLDGVSGTELAEFQPFEASFTGGVFVAAADLDRDGRAEVIVSPDQGGGPVVAVYSGAKLAVGTTGDAAQVARFFGIEDPDFRGGARPALGDVNGDGTPDLVVSAGFLGGPRIAVFDGTDLAAGSPKPGHLVGDFFAFEDTLRNGAFVAAGDVTGDGKADLAFGGGPGGAPRVRLFDGAKLLAAGPFSSLDAVASNQLANFFAGDPSLRGGVRLAMPDTDGDHKADLVVGSGEGEESHVRVYTSATLLANPSPAPDRDLDPFGTVLANGVFVG